jgi:TetR/AcrR family transcriptional repressor of bet genes
MSEISETSDTGDPSETGETTAVPGRSRLPHDARRRLIIETTLSCLARHGAEGTSLRLVCREMKVAPSLVTHFFAGWHDLLTATYGLLAERFITQLAPILARDFPTARARMDAVIRYYLGIDGAGANTMGANIAFWQLSRSVIDLKTAFGRFLADRQCMLRDVLAGLAVESGANIALDDMTACLILMMDGLWLEMSLNPGGIAEQRALQMCWAWIDAVIGQPSPRASATPAAPTGDRP